jgi:hypothetical protein
MHGRLGDEGLRRRDADGARERGGIERLVLGGEAGEQHGEEREGERSAHVSPWYDGISDPVKTSAGLLW